MSGHSKWNNIKMCIRDSTNSKESEAMHMKQKTMETKRFWISISIGLAIVVVLLAANLWQMNRENSVTGAKQVWSECIEH